LILYLDTSAKAKLYADEPGSALVRQAVAKAEIIASNIIAYVETRAALARPASIDKAGSMTQSWPRSNRRLKGIGQGFIDSLSMS
jgi:uncharacterized protein with PIN domain